ncbi:MAG: 50S ribosomal protein L18 [Rhodospirillaceae bacterium]|nr:50S ribosomal protein L18 [Rhodospirillaceae bacterium]|tara:strand:- start:402 stop:764 length:363 start_codon:yes stop_codon:yes gene_type:complete
MLKSKELFIKRARRNRSALKKISGDRVRLSVFRSSKNIYVQVIDDAQGNTITSASSLDKDLRGVLKSGGDRSAAEAVGKLVAERALEKGLKQVVFDRGGYRYHGRIKALAEGARQGGLKF